MMMLVRAARQTTGHQLCPLLSQAYCEGFFGQIILATINSFASIHIDCASHRTATHSLRWLDGDQSLGDGRLTRTQPMPSAAELLSHLYNCANATSAGHLPGLNDASCCRAYFLAVRQVSAAPFMILQERVDLSQRAALSPNKLQLHGFHHAPQQHLGAATCTHKPRTVQAARAGVNGRAAATGQCYGSDMQAAADAVHQ